MKPSGETNIERYLNIYTESAGEGEESNSLEAIAQNCLMVELSYTPYLLYHTIIPQSSSNEVNQGASIEIYPQKALKFMYNFFADCVADIWE